MFQSYFPVQRTHLAGVGREDSMSVSTRDQTLKVNVMNRDLNLIL